MTMMPCDFLSLPVEGKRERALFIGSFSYDDDVALSLTLISEQQSEKAYLIGCLYDTAHRRRRRRTN